MCGIFAIIEQLNSDKKDKVTKCFDKLSKRDPDESSKLKEIDTNVYMGFHRLHIVGKSKLGMQPFTYTYGDYEYTLICNGEIYNYKELIDKYDLDVSKDDSDCKVILPLFYKLCNNDSYTVSEVVNLLDGEFAFIMYGRYLDEVHKASDIDDKYDNMIICRDHMGIRPLFIGRYEDGICLSSEVKGIPDYYTDIEIVKPGTYKDSGCDKFVSYKSYIYKPIDITYNECVSLVRSTLDKTVSRMLQSCTDSNYIGAFLSGGLDSSIIVSLLSKRIPNLQVFSVGIGDTDDIINASKLVQFLNTKYKRNIKLHILKIDTKDIVDNIEDTIYKIESYDTTTVRASTPQNILSRWIKDNFDVKVLFSGEGADELFAGYLYSRGVPSAKDLGEDAVRLINELVYYDVLRTDRAVSDNGLEVRVPFLMKDVINLVMKIPAKYKMSSKQVIEKRLLRDAFKDILPDCIFKRRKEAFSDSVSSKKGNSVLSIKSYAENTYSNDEFDKGILKYNHCQPRTKEELLYRDIFSKYYTSGNRSNLIPDFWKLQWTDKRDPSATCLDFY